MVAEQGSVRWLDQEQSRIWRAYLEGVGRINAHLDADLREFGIDLSEYEVLVCLDEAEDSRLRMSELAEASHQSRSRLTHTVARMERDGLVIRETCPTDRRGVWANLTDAGRELLRTAAPSHVSAVREILVDAVSEEDFRALGRVFETVNAITSEER